MVNDGQLAYLLDGLGKHLAEHKRHITEMMFRMENLESALQVVRERALGNGFKRDKDRKKTD